MDGETDAQIASQLGLTASVGQGVAPSLYHAVGGTAGGCATADEALDAHFDHEVKGALAGGYDGLPALNGQGTRAGDQCDFFKLVATVGHLGWYLVVLAVVGKGGLVEGLHHDLHLLLEQLAVGVLVDDGVAEALYFAAVVATTHAENHPAASKDVSSGEVLCQTERVPHGRDVKPTAQLDALREVGEVDVVHQQVGDAFVAFPLEVVLGHPERVVAQPIHGLSDG